MSLEKIVQSATERPGAFAVKALFALVGLSVVFSVIGFVFGWFGEAAETTQREFGPSAALEKYEWFKDAAQQLNARKQDIENYQGLVDSTEEQWGEVSVTEWPRDVRQGHQQNKMELAGLITAYNGLVAEYRSASKKFNWSAFEDQDDRPPLEFDDWGR